MDLLTVIGIIVLVGILVFLVNKAPFIDAEFKKIITYVAIAAVIIWLVSLFIPGLHTIRVGR